MEDNSKGHHYHRVYKGIKIDPFRLQKLYDLDGAQMTILKKTLVTGERGYKDAIQDYKDIIGAANRAIEMIEEDNESGVTHVWVDDKLIYDKYGKDNG